MKKTNTLLSIILGFISLSTIANGQFVQTSLKNYAINNILYNGTRCFATTNANGVYTSTDNGDTWTAAGLSGKVTFSAVQSGNNLFAGTSADGVFLSTDNGGTWNAVNTGLTNTKIKSLGMFGNNLFAGNLGSSGSGIFLSTDNGSNWTSKSTGLSIFVTYNAFAMIGNNLFAGTLSGVYVSTNNGSSWTAANTGITTPYYSTFTLATIGNNLFAGTPGGVFVSTNNGTSWTAKNTGMGADTSIASFCVVGTNIFAGTGSGKLFLSNNNGDSWTEIATGLPALGVTALTVAGNVMLLGTQGVGIYKRPLSEMGITVGINDLTNKSGIDVHPNPTADGIFQINNAQNASLKVCNLIGEVLYSERCIATNHTLNLNHLPAGIYLLQIADGTQLSTQKLVIQK